MRFIEELNADQGSNDSARYGLTEFSDMSREEFVDRKLQRHMNKRLNSHKRHHHQKNESSMMNHLKKRSADGLPDVVDW